MAIAVQPAKQVEEKRRTNMKQRRVVVTGMGIVSPLGHAPDVFYSNLLEGVSGISEIENFDCANYSTVYLLVCKFTCHVTFKNYFVLDLSDVLYIQSFSGKIKI